MEKFLVVDKWGHQRIIEGNIDVPESLYSDDMLILRLEDEVMEYFKEV